MHPLTTQETAPRTSVRNGAQPTAIAGLSQAGYRIFPDLLTAEALFALRTELGPHFARTPHCAGDFHGWKTTRVCGLLDKAPSTRALVLHKQILKVARRVLAPSCDRIQLNLTQAIRVHPGERAQAPHRDQEMWPLEPKLRPWIVNVMWALTDFTDENGATRLWPLDHNLAGDRSDAPSLSVPAVMKAGSALVFLGSLTHGAGANGSNAPRDGIIVSYCLGWLRQYENQYLAYPPDVARTFAKPLQRLIGYQAHRPNLGFWEGQDPQAALRPRPRKMRGHIDALPPAIARQLKAHYGENQ